MSKVELSKFNNSNWPRGRPLFVELFWQALSWFFVESWIPGTVYRLWLLKLFGAKIGRGVVIKPRVRVKFPWRLVVGDHTWIGEDVWIDNLAPVTVGSNVCISQGAYLCTGSHDWNLSTFDLIVKPIAIGDGAWVSAKSTVGPGVMIGEGAVLGLGSTTSKDLEPWCVYAGNPVSFVRKRSIAGDLP